MLNATTTAGAQLRNLVIIVICIALLAGINVVFNDYIVRVISTIFIFMILAVSYNLINGVTGQLSLEPNGFVAVGALSLIHISEPTRPSHISRMPSSA